MANEQQNPTQQSTPQQQPASSSTRRSVPAVFGDGSTREQREQLVKEAEEANRSTKQYADAERKARSDS